LPNSPQGFHAECGLNAISDRLLGQRLNSWFPTDERPCRVLPVEFPHTLQCPFFKRGAVFGIASLSTKAKDHVVKKAKQDSILLLEILPSPLQISIGSTVSKWEGLNSCFQATLLIGLGKSHGTWTKFVPMRPQDNPPCLGFREWKAPKHHH
jgi:hypothetical protein